MNADLGVGLDLGRIRGGKGDRYRDRLAAGLAAGVTPFLIGDAIKIALAAGLLPAAWKVVERVESR